MDSIYKSYVKAVKKQVSTKYGIKIGEFKKTFLPCLTNEHRKTVVKFMKKMKKDNGDKSYFIPMPTLLLPWAYNLNYVENGRVKNSCVYHKKRRSCGEKDLIEYATSWTKKNAPFVIENMWDITTLIYLQEKPKLIVLLKDGAITFILKYNRAVCLEILLVFPLVRNIKIDICSGCGSIMKGPPLSCSICDKEKKDEIVKALGCSTVEGLPFSVAPEEIIGKMRRRQGLSFPLLEIARKREGLTRLLQQIK